MPFISFKRGRDTADERLAELEATVAAIHRSQAVIEFEIGRAHV